MQDATEKTNVETRILKIEERLKKLEEENDILKIELANSIIEKIKIDKAKSRFLDEHFENSDRCDRKIDEECKRREKMIKDMKERMDILEKENSYIVSEKESSLFKSIISQAQKVKKRTRKNPFDI